MVEKIHHTFIIPKTQALERLDHALATLLPQYSRSQIQEWIKSGWVMVDGQTKKGKTKVKGDEEITINASIMPPKIWESEPIPLNIVYEDEVLLIINKPVGMVVHPGAGNPNSTLLNALLHHAPQLKMLPRAGILHRLDKNTSGLLIIAKTQEALKHLSLQLKKRTISREYQAIAYGSMISGGRIDLPLARHPLDRKRMAVVENGKPSVTHYRIIEKFRAHAHLLVRLETGRTHQIRVHLSHIHHPLVGDATYGGRVRATKGMTSELIDCLRHFKHQALHAFALGLIHPISGEQMQFQIDLPTDMQQLLLLLKQDSVRKTHGLHHT